MHRAHVLKERWSDMTPSDWDAFANGWLAELRVSSPPGSDDLGGAVILMNFTADPDDQWQFIRSAVAHADSDEELSAIAAGPVEHLLGWHGENVIAWVEAQAAEDGVFARMLTGVWKYKMTDEVWARVQALQGRVSDPLPAFRGHS